MTAPANPRILEDRHPANAVLPDGTLVNRSRTFITAREGDEPGRIWVYASLGEPVFDQPWIPEQSTAPRGDEPWTIATPEGPVTLHPKRGCNCGRLGHWRPPFVSGPDARNLPLGAVIRRAREAAGLEDAS